MNQILVFAGTTEGRKLIEFILSASKEFQVYACVATRYGKSLLSPSDRLTISSRPLDFEEMISLMKTHDFSMVFDTTHPYAVEVSKNLRKASKLCCLPYYRVLRPESDIPTHSLIAHSKPVIHVNSMEEAVDFFQQTTGNILVTTGSKELPLLCALPDFSDRIYPRILPNPIMLQTVIEQGFSPKNIICMQGPFSKELNIAMLKQTKSAFLLTKSSGFNGGFLEKLEAAAELNVTSVVIGRPPQSDGISYQEACNIILNLTAQ